eukprot:CAMPEP_0115371470 /NCGR_PEP_ID=MMETSP0271-20121206/396_1 /TAXON_ID=71861 /ORGANISM="Scrippsiella trochoidea, Strain CCMP3099" /LENGTH=161 /DNA_ID=CAMNT_0002794369 /DNA_START=343 /DNA_END=825 /DNA_ORIENTATION=+
MFEDASVSAWCLNRRQSVTGSDHSTRKIRLPTERSRTRDHVPAFRPSTSQLASSNSANWSSTSVPASFCAYVTSPCTLATRTSSTRGGDRPRAAFHRRAISSNIAALTCSSGCTGTFLNRTRRRAGGTGSLDGVGVTAGASDVPSTTSAALPFADDDAARA